MRSYVLGPSKFEPFEIGAFLTAVMAFPSPAEEDAMQEAASALCAGTIRASCDADPADAARVRRLYPEYAEIDARECRRRLRTLKRRLKDRMIASRMSLGFFKEGMTSRPARLPPEMARLSLNELSKLVLEESRESVADNVERWAWRETLPVIHIAAAYQFLLRACSAEGTPYGHDLEDLEAHRIIVEMAGINEQLVLADRRFGIAPDKLVRLLWVE